MIKFVQVSFKPVYDAVNSKIKEITDTLTMMHQEGCSTVHVHVYSTFVNLYMKKHR